MNIAAVQRILGSLLMLFSLSMLPPAAVALWYGDGGSDEFLKSFLLILTAGFLLWVPVRRTPTELRLREGFLIVALFWILLGGMGSLPLLLAPHPDLTFTEAVFESVSGFTTTGATIITALDGLPKSILYYRQQLQALGGMSIVVLAVAILPMLSVGGMQLYRAETPGPIKDAKLTPRIQETAKSLLVIYTVLIIACALSYWAAGMSLFDAVGHSFSTISTGGFSTHDASMGYFRSPLLECLAILFMILGGVNFSLHFLAWRRGASGIYLRDPECRMFLGLILGSSLLVGLKLYLAGGVPDFWRATLDGAFHIVSSITTTGFTLYDFSGWPGFLPVLVILVSFIGGCGGSTSGGMKVMRILLLIKQGMREIGRLIHPRAELPVRVGGRAVSDKVVESVWGFFSIYVVLFVFMMLIVLNAGLDQVSAFAAVATTLNNLGPGLGEVAVNFATVDSLTKWVAIAAMLLGRLEIFPLLVLLTPSFWRG